MSNVADLTGGVLRGVQTARQMQDMKNQNALAALMQEQGPQIIAGDQNALAQLAQFDPMMALGIQQRQQDQQFRIDNRNYQRARDARADARADKQFEMQVLQQAAAMSDAERKQRLANSEQNFIEATRFFHMGDLDGVNNVLIKSGEQPLNDLKEFPALVARYQGVVQIMNNYNKLTAVDEPKPLSPAGKVQADINSGFLPESTPLSRPNTVVNNNMGQDKFSEAFAKADATALAEVSTVGNAAIRNQGRLDQLGALLDQAPSGFSAALAQKAGEFGVNTEGLSDIQAAQALINSMVPEQRQPGSGPMSDADLALFIQSLPRMINTREGNQQILSTLRAINQYDAEGAQIVQALRAGQFDRAQAFEMLQARGNPLSGLSGPQQTARPAGENPFLNLSEEQFLQIDIMNLTPEQIDQLFEAQSQ